MGLLSKLNPKSNSSTTSDTASTITESSTNPLHPSDQPHKKSFYEKYQERKRGPGSTGLSDEELTKYTGKSREEFDTWKTTAPGVAGGQAAGSLTAGGNSGLGTAFGAGEGLGGYGYEAGKIPDRKGDRVIR